MRDTNMMKITEEESNSIEGLLTYKEITDTLCKMKHYKSPGISGFTAEFFKVFWKQLGYVVLRSVNEGFENGEL